MICISVTPESRKLAKVDLFNASRQCDLIELCLDHLVKEPDVGQLLEGVTKPVIISCRRPQEGGKFQGTAEERQGLLRQAIVAAPAYVELDLELAAKIPRFGKTKRIISHTSLDRPLENVDEIVSRASKVNADVVKLTCLTSTLQSAWPLLAAVSATRDVPVVGVGFGNASTTFSLLARRHGSPWIYAALERGMEAHPGQASVAELDEVYRWRQIDEKTRFVGVAGSGRPDGTTIRIWNRGFEALKIDKRCLPLPLDGLGGVEKMLAALRIKSLLVGSDFGSTVLALAKIKDEAAEKSQFADLLLHQPEGWCAYGRIGRSTVKAIEKKLMEMGAGERALERRNVLILGAGGMARSIACALGGNRGILSISAPQDKQARRIAETFSLRHVPFAGLYETLADVVIVADPELVAGHHKTEVNPSFLRPNMLVVDVCRLPETTEFLRQAGERGATVVDPREIHVDRISWQFRTINGEALPPEIASATNENG
ncbi:MAG: type I 3-dehydroquinate dehydratase [Planctomycetaceae bacterium]